MRTPLSRWYDARALSLVDGCLDRGRFTEEAVIAISCALARAEQLQRDAHAAAAAPAADTMVASGR